MKVYAASSWRLSEDRPIYYKPKTGKRIVIARIADGLSEEAEKMVTETLVRILGSLVKHPDFQKINPVTRES